MFFFKKPEYRELMLPFELFQEEGDDEAGIIGITAAGDIFGEQKICYSCYCLKKTVMYDNGDYEDILRRLAACQGRFVKVRFRMKAGEVKDYRIDVPSLAAACADDRLEQMELVGWGLLDELKK